MGSLTQILQISSLIVAHCTRVWDGLGQRGDPSLCLYLAHCIARREKNLQQDGWSILHVTNAVATRGRQKKKKMASHLLLGKPNQPRLGSVVNPWAPPEMTFCQQLSFSFSIFLQDELKITWYLMHSHFWCNPRTWKEEEEEEELGMEENPPQNQWHKKALQRQKQLGICARWLSGRRRNIRRPLATVLSLHTIRHFGFGGF